MCKEYIGHASKIIWKDGKIAIKSFNLPCNKWSCPECAKRKAIILGNRVKAGFAGERIRFATFTDNGEGSFCQRLQNLKAAWNRLRLALSRQYGLTKFFWVLEFGGKRGRPHLHCLLNCYIPQRKLSELAASSGFGAVVDIREVKDGGGFGYVFKYLSKDCGLKAGASALRSIHGRRFGLSRNIPPVAKDSLTSRTAEYSSEVLAGEQLRARVESLASVFVSKIDSEQCTPSGCALRGSPTIHAGSTPHDIQTLTAVYGFYRRKYVMGQDGWVQIASELDLDLNRNLVYENQLHFGGGRAPLASSLPSS